MKRAWKIADLPVGTIFVHKTWYYAKDTVEKQYIGIVYEQHLGSPGQRNICVYYCDGETEVFFEYELPDNQMYILEVK